MKKYIYIYAIIVAIFLFSDSAIVQSVTFYIGFAGLSAGIIMAIFDKYRNIGLSDPDHYFYKSMTICALIGSYVGIAYFVIFPMDLDQRIDEMDSEARKN